MRTQGKTFDNAKKVIRTEAAKFSRALGYRIPSAA